jgi:3-hydroxyacyl-[acyl-carrier-protein] dehydratase
MEGMEGMGAESLDPSIVEHIRRILRRDLKLGSAAQIPEDMPFVNSEVDMDSLDILLLVTSIEKEFGIEIPSEDVGREVFQSMASLSRYVQQQKNGRAAAKDYLSQLPHQPPFRFVTSVQRVCEGESAEGRWSITGQEPFFAGHFPGRPIVPGTLIAEAMAQIAGLAGPRVSPAGGEDGKLVHLDVRFNRPVAPPAELVLKAKFVRSMGDLQQFEVEAWANGEAVASGMLALHRSALGGGDS